MGVIENLTFGSLLMPHVVAAAAAGNLFVGGTARAHGIDTASGVIEKHPNAGGPTWKPD